MQHRHPVEKDRRIGKLPPMSDASRGWILGLLDRRKRYKQLIGIGTGTGTGTGGTATATATLPGDWPIRTLEAIEHLVPPQVMALLPDLLSSWLQRSVRRDDFAASPVLAVERLYAQPRPIQDGADKDTLVGAVLTMSASLHLALGMLLEMLPQDKSRERLGEVLCPTLGHLLASLQTTLTTFEQNTSATASSSPSLTKSATKTHEMQAELSPSTRVPTEPSRQPSLRMKRNGSAASRASEVPGQPVEASGPGSSFEQLPGAAHHQHAEPDHHPRTGLIEALQAEMRVQAAIRVAVESLEFAEGQLRLIKQLNGLHGGSFEIVQKHFYEGYNRLLFRALDLERKEFADHKPRPPRPSQPDHRRKRSVSFQHTLPGPSYIDIPRPSTAQPVYHEPPPSTRRRPIQATGEDDSMAPKRKPILRRRLSLAEELAMVGEDSESGYHDEASEVMSSANGESESESGNDSHGKTGRGYESEDYSVNEESVDERSTTDSNDGQESEEKTIGVRDLVSCPQDSLGQDHRLQIRLPGLKQQST
ncbi:hypothetical protein VTK26DRAFT_6508 [Humicola hyalothermophila]